MRSSSWSQPQNSLQEVISPLVFLMIDHVSAVQNLLSFSLVGPISWSVLWAILNSRFCWHTHILDNCTLTSSTAMTVVLVEIIADFVLFCREYWDERRHSQERTRLSWMNSLNYYYCISGTVSLNYHYTCTSVHTIINHLTVSPKPVVSIGLFLSTYTSNFLRLSGVAWEPCTSWSAWTCDYRQGLYFWNPVGTKRET